MTELGDSKTLLLLSGGMDSATLLYFLLEQHHTVRTLSISYNQRHSRELQSAAAVAKAAGVYWSWLDLSDWGKELGGSSQTDMSVPVPEGHYAAENMKLTVVPNRNMVLLATAGGIAISSGCQVLAYAAHAGDHTIYPDCRPEFVEALNKAFALCDWKHLELFAPFLHWTKGDIAVEGLRLGVPFELTWSCYAGDAKPCGKCGACTERREAFEFAGAADPMLI